MKRDKIIQAIKDYDQIIIHRHLRPDPDALGSQAGLKEIIQQSFPDKQVSIVGIDDPAFTFLVEMDSVHEADYQGALVIVCDTANTDRIDDKRYTLGDQVIKIDHHPDPDGLGSQAGLKEIIQQSFPDKQVSIVGIDDPAFTFLVEMDSVHEADYQGALVIVCDTANTDRIDDKRYTLGDQVIKIDHHPNVDEYGDIQWVDTTAS